MDVSSASPAGPAPHPRSATRRPLRSWYLFDVAVSVIDALMVTFVFSAYLTTAVGDSREGAAQALSAGAVTAAVVIAVLAPLAGWLADRTGRRGALIGAFTAVAVGATAACVVVEPRQQFLLLGVVLLSTANTAKELALVGYYAVLPRLAPRERIGRISGRGWAAGYIGSILATAFVLFGFVTPGFLGLPTQDALNVRAVALFCAAWCAVFAAPLVVALLREERGSRVRDRTADGPARGRPGLLTPYREIARLIRGLWRTDRPALHFLVASAVVRDGLSGIFAFGGVIAAGTFGFSLTEVMLFAIAGNLAAGLGALVGGQLDDRFGPRRVIVAALLTLLAAGAPLLVLESPAAFWVCGLVLCTTVGPAQSAARSYLGRFTTPGTEGSLFGLYATTGRALSFLSPLLFGLAIGLFGAQRHGILGILSVVALGLVLMIGLPARPRPVPAPR